MDLQHEADVGAEHADDLTVEQAVGAIRRCERVSWDALVVNGTDTLGAERHTTRVVAGGHCDDRTTEWATAAVRHARRIWWDNNQLVFTIGFGEVTIRLPECYPLQPRTCMFCAETVHGGRCVVVDGPNFRPGMSA